MGVVAVVARSGAVTDEAGVLVVAVAAALHVGGDVLAAGVLPAPEPLPLVGPVLPAVPLDLGSV